MPLNERELTETDKAWYRLGFLNCRAGLGQTVKLLQTTNTQLWEEITRLDRLQPVAGVVISYELANKLIKVLRKGGKSYYLANKIAKIQAKSQKKDFRLLIDHLAPND